LPGSFHATVSLLEAVGGRQPRPEHVFAPDRVTHEIQPELSKVHDPMGSWPHKRWIF
jgi:hypothetical protein